MGREGRRYGTFRDKVAELNEARLIQNRSLFRPGKYLLVVEPYARRRAEPCGPEERHEIDRALDLLHSWLDQHCLWELAGGLSIGAGLGGFYRNHLDIDIQIDETELPGLVDALEFRGLVLCRRLFWIRLPGGRAAKLLRPVSCTEAARGGYRFLSLIRSDAGRGHLPPLRLLDSIDVCVYHLRGDTLIRHDGKIAVPISYRVSSTYTTPDGRNIRLVDLRYMEIIKQRRHTAVDREDLMRIRQFLAGSGR